MKRSLSVFMTIVILVCTLCLAGCDTKYKSSFDAVGCVHNNTSDHAMLKFSSFKGTMVFKFDVKDKSSLSYKMKLDEGSADFYYDNGSSKKKSCSINAGDDFDGGISNLKEGTLYVIIETNKKCKGGDFEFDID